ncbi:hypothetical protein IVB36_21510 [Bradyrhizobium sp. 35]|uniref:hypothetical protein n=1 Tax=Bradyrhizobium sp. 35 TaxID=2782670 RepID=UPI001FFAC39D|nr:hypothetical protein [Bradyrhizobium sp. 35]MCK1453385.1 hypothetical protein [Bradyrhizobium sp. 35]
MKPTSTPDWALFDFVRLAKESGTAQPLDPQALFYCSTCSTSKTKKRDEESEAEAGGGSLSLSFPVAILAQQVEHVEQVERLLILLDVFVFGFWNEVDQVDHARCAESTPIRRATMPTSEPSMTRKLRRMSPRSDQPIGAGHLSQEFALAPIAGRQKPSEPTRAEGVAQRIEGRRPGGEV